MKLFSLLMASLILLAACATMTQSKDQHIAVSTFYRGQQLDNARCTLENDKGVWHLTSQGATRIMRGSGDLTITCVRKGYPRGIVIVPAGLIDGVWVDRMAGGLVGSVIDNSTGATLIYPNRINVEMGRTIAAEPKIQQKK